MPIATALISAGGRFVATIARKALDWGFVRSAPLLFAKMPWDVQSKYDLDTTLDPGEKYDCETGIPAGFAISRSRATPITISLKMLTLGIEERAIVQVIRRRIAV
jgi:hypothetical protein